MYINNMEKEIQNQTDDNTIKVDEKDNLKDWINRINLTDVSLTKTENMLLAVELRDKLVSYKKWAIAQIEQKAK
jgi:hypothetical protein